MLGNIDIGEINMNDNAPTYELGIGTPRIPYLNTLYAMFSMGMGPDATFYSENVMYSTNIWEKGQDLCDCTLVMKNGVLSMKKAIGL